MGSINAHLWGSGTVDLALDSKRATEGGWFSGRIMVRGDDKLRRLDSLDLRLLQVAVHFQQGPASPQVDTSILLDTPLARCLDLRPGEVVRHNFRIALPPAVGPSTHQTSYQVQAWARFSNGEEFNHHSKLKVVEREWGADPYTLKTVYKRWPALRSRRAEPLLETLSELRRECYSEREYLQVLVPVLVRLLQHSDSEVGRRAFWVWCGLAIPPLRPEQLEPIEQRAFDPEVPSELLQEFIYGAARFVQDGALGFVQRLARHQEKWVRRTLAGALHLYAVRPPFQGRREVLLQLAEDPEAEVRAAAVEALVEFAGDSAVVQRVARMLEQDGAAEVREQCVEFLLRAR